ncbi:General substrate transporter [Niveomyces insectorum RCEF 264]|uniref:General substrate transporter n=1 Tax=Niveomyces insectorum RCEF 264 TaxID=1081102 RepID=A0A167SLV8_9HYPO|nr:General substrate transporter [Niveomyces insectorum RCEF 264]
MAHERSERPPESRISLFNLLLVLALCLGSITYGYTFSITSTTLGQPGWYDYFDLVSDETNSRYAYTKRIQGAMNGLFCAGGFFGSIFIGWACNAIGRKRCLFIASPLAILGGALQAGAVHIAMFLVGRFIGGFAVGILVTLIPLFQAEIAPPAVRGFLVSQHGFILVLGYSVAAWTGFACYFSDNLDFQWRFPLAEQCLWPLGLLILTPWIPDSPRWLILKDRPNEAWTVIAKLHGIAGHDQDSPMAAFAREEFYQMRQQVAADKRIIAVEGGSVKTLFVKPSYRKRMFCAFITMFAAQSTANLVVYNYSVLLYQGLGFSNMLSLMLSALFVTIACLGNFVCSLLIDRVGRVRLLLIGITGCMVSLIFEAAIDAQYTGSDNEPALRAGVFFMFLYITFYGCCIDANTFVYCSEIFPSHFRAYGNAWSLCTLFLSSMVYLEAAPTAFAVIGWRYYLLFICLSALNIAIIWYYFPETKGLSLEEIGEVFGDDVAVHITHLTAAEREQLDRNIDAEKTTGEANHVDAPAASSESA